MLSETQIDRLIKPLLKKQYGIEFAYITAVAKRLKNKDKANYTADFDELNNRVSDYAVESMKDIQKILRKAAEDAYIFAEPFYNYRGIPFMPYDENYELQAITDAIINLNISGYVTLTNTAAFVLRDSINPLIWRLNPLGLAYKTILNSPKSTPDIIKDMVQNGIVIPEGKRMTRFDSLVRRDILNGVRDIQQSVQDYTGAKVDSDGIELSAHINSAPDHEPIQGHQFSNAEFEKLQTQQNFEDVNGTAFGGILRPIGFWNCRHIAMRIILGQKQPDYTPEELQELSRNNANGYTTRGGETRSRYWCTQKMRNYELRIRQAREGEAAASAADETELAGEYGSRIERLEREYRVFCARSGLEPQIENTRV